MEPEQRHKAVAATSKTTEGRAAAKASSFVAHRHTHRETHNTSGFNTRVHSKDLLVPRLG